MFPSMRTDGEARRFDEILAARPARYELSRMNIEYKDSRYPSVFILYLLINYITRVLRV